MSLNATLYCYYCQCVPALRCMSVLSCRNLSSRTSHVHCCLCLVERRNHIMHSCPESVIALVVASYTLRPAIRGKLHVGCPSEFDQVRPFENEWGDF